MVFIFDFDGTIADTHRHMIAIFNRLAAEFNFKIIHEDEIERLKDKSSRDIIRHLRIPLFKIPALIARAKKELRNNIHAVKPVPGITESLHSLKNLGVTIGILSSNTHENIAYFLKNHRLDIFDFISPTPRVWSKNTALLKIMTQHGLAPEALCYIGDEIRDILAARKLGIRVAAVGWGYNSMRALEQSNPDFLLHTPDNLLSLYSSLISAGSRSASA